MKIPIFSHLWRYIQEQRAYELKRKQMPLLLAGIAAEAMHQRHLAQMFWRSADDLQRQIERLEEAD